MHTTSEAQRDESPAPAAYDGHWLEMLENPDATGPRRETGSGLEGAPRDTVGRSPGSGSVYRSALS